MIFGDCWTLPLTPPEYKSNKMNKRAKNHATKQKMNLKSHHKRKKNAPNRGNDFILPLKKGRMFLNEECLKEKDN